MVYLFITGRWWLWTLFFLSACFMFSVAVKLMFTCFKFVARLISCKFISFNSYRFCFCFMVIFFFRLIYFILVVRLSNRCLIYSFILFTLFNLFFDELLTDSIFTVLSISLQNSYPLL